MKIGSWNILRDDKEGSWSALHDNYDGAPDGYRFLFIIEDDLEELLLSMEKAEADLQKPIDRSVKVVSILDAAKAKNRRVISRPDPTPPSAA